jgi:dephospho-CoA kinase
MSARTLLLTGGLATGKTAVAREVVAAAADLGLHVAAIDLDWLCWATGATLGVDELISRNLADIAENYAQAGIDDLVLARAVLSPLSLQAVSEAVPGREVMVVRLHASRATLERRIRARDSGAELEEHLAEIDELSGRAAKTVPSAPVVLNEDRALREVALEVMRLARWIDV